MAENPDIEDKIKKVVFTVQVLEEKQPKGVTMENLLNHFSVYESDSSDLTNAKCLKEYLEKATVKNFLLDVQGYYKIRMPFSTKPVCNKVMLSAVPDYKFNKGDPELSELMNTLNKLEKEEGRDKYFSMNQILDFASKNSGKAELKNEKILKKILLKALELQMVEKRDDCYKIDHIGEDLI